VTIGLASNLWFSIASVLFLTILIGLLTDRVVMPRLGPWTSSSSQSGDEAPGNELSPAEARGLRFAGLGVLAFLAVFAVQTLPSWGPLRDPQTRALIGDSPFMTGLIGFIVLLFLVRGCTKIRPGGGRRYGGVADAALFHLDATAVDGAFRRLDAARAAVRHLSGLPRLAAAPIPDGATLRNRRILGMKD
jgi:hypothetical protein